MASRWNLKGTVAIACNCDYGCPCNFNARPTHGNCEGGWTWYVHEGSVGDVSLEGMIFSVFVKWPGAIHEGNGEALIFIDQRANRRQQDAISTLVKGEVGGPWGILASTWPKVHGPKLVAYSFSENGIHSHITAGDAFALQLTTIENPVTGTEAHPAIVLPEGLILKRADLGTSSILHLNDEISMDHSGKYTALGPFEYSGT
jgi:hypothetical protein